jgi:PAS domain S-box-containing protein
MPRKPTSTTSRAKPRARTGSKAGESARIAALERKCQETAAALTASEERYDLVMEAVNEGVYDLNLMTGEVYYSPRVLALLGLEASDLRTAEDGFKRIHPDDLPHYRAAVIDHLKGNTKRFDCEFRFRSGDGGWRWAHQHGVAQRDRTGRAIRMTGSVGEITDAKRVQEALGKSEERFRVLVEGSIQGIVIHRDGQLVFVNRAAAEMHGYDTETMIGMNIADFLAPDYIEQVTAFARARMVGDKNLPNTYEYYGRKRDGTEFPVQLMANRITWSDGPAVQCTLVDISEQKRAEARLRDAIENIPDAFVLFDRNDRLVVANQRFREFYPELAKIMRQGVTTAEDMFRERVRVGAVGEFDVPVEEYVRWRMAMRLKDGGTPSVHRHSDGRWLRTTERRTSEGGVVAISTDVTELKRREADLAVSMAQAETANRAKSEFLANMSHELRTPLNAIIGCSEAMQSEFLGPLGNERYQEYVEDIRSSGNHLLQIINDLLDLSKIEAGKLELDEQRVDINELVESSLKIIRERAERGGITTEISLAAPPPHLWADERTCKQVLFNLLSNAVKFTETGGTITVSTELEPDGRCVVRVRDTGIGIPEEDLEKILEPFTQVEASLVRNHEGTGLGLPLTKAIVEMHGGEMTVESAVGVGTSVSVHFPAERLMEPKREAGDAA